MDALFRALADETLRIEMEGMHMFTGKTKNLGLIGWPVEHSLSPCMQNAAIKKAGLDYVYIAMPVRPNDLKSALSGLISIGFSGINVTIPHKVAVMPLLDEIDENARMIGAVNTILFQDGAAKGYNTDAAGFIHGLEAAGFVPMGKKAVLLGAGGAARAVIWGLVQEGVTELVVGARNLEKARALANVFETYIQIEVYDWQTEAFAEALRETDLLVNATPLGMRPQLDSEPPVVWGKLKKQAVVYDLIYNPVQTKFLKSAAVRGHQTINGERMLAGQGAASFEIWTKAEPDVLAMLEALRNVNVK